MMRIPCVHRRGGKGQKGQPIQIPSKKRIGRKGQWQPRADSSDDDTTDEYSGSETEAQKPPEKEADSGVFSEYTQMASRIAQLYNQPELSDLLLELNDGKHVQKLHVHRAILGASSEYFAQLIKEANLPAKGGVLRMDNVDINIVEMVVQFIYKGEAEISAENALGVLDAADTYRVEGLKLAAQKCISQSINRDQVFALLSSARQRNASYVVDSCIQFLVEHATQCLKSDELLSVPRDVMLQLVADDRLDAAEVDIVRALLRWAERNRGDTSVAECLREFVPLIRYTFLRARDIRTLIMPLNIVPADMLAEALLHRGDPLDEEQTQYNPQLRERAAGARIGRWSDTHCDAMIKLSKRKNKARCGSGTWMSVLTEGSVKSGVHYFEVAFDPAQSCMIGVISPEHFTPGGGGCYAGDGYMFYLASHQCFHAGAPSAPAGLQPPPPGTGTKQDRWGVLLDLQTRTIEFFFGGKSFGVAFRKIPRGTYSFAVDMHQSVSATIVRTASNGRVDSLGLIRTKDQDEDGEDSPGPAPASDDEE